MPSAFAPHRPRRPERWAWPWLLVLVLAVQGIGQGFARVSTPTHAHRGVASSAHAAHAAHGTRHAAAHLAPRDGQRSIPWIGDEPQPNHAHAALGAPAHAHAFDDASVVYLEAAGGDLAEAALAVAAPGLLPPGSPTISAAPEGHAAWIGAPGWYALARSTAPLERPPRTASRIA